MAYLETERRFLLSCGMSPLPDKKGSDMVQVSFGVALQGLLTSLSCVSVQPSIQVMEATEATLEVRMATMPRCSSVVSRVRTFFLPMFHSSARPVSENWNCPGCNSCGLRNVSSLHGTNCIRASKSKKKSELWNGLPLLSSVVPQSHCRASLERRRRICRKPNSFEIMSVSLFVVISVIVLVKYSVKECRKNTYGVSQLFPMDAYLFRTILPTLLF